MANRIVQAVYDLQDKITGKLKSIGDACRESGTPVSVCGEIAGRPLEAFALIALGFDRLSMPPAGIGPK